MYGVWAIMNLLVSYSGFAEFGLRIPLVKYVAESYAQRDIDEINRLVNTVFSVYLALSCIIALFFLLNLDWIIIRFFHEHAATLHLAQMLLLVMLAFIIQLVFSVFPALLSGLQRVDLAVFITLVNQLLGAGGSVLALALGFGLEGLVGSYVIITVLVVVLQWFITRKLFSALHLNPLGFSMSTLRKVFGFSARVQVTTLASFADTNLNRTLLAYFLTPVDVGYYQVAMRVWNTVGALPLTLTRTVTPAASELAALGHDERLRRLYFRSLKYVSAIGFPLLACTMVLIHPFVRVWLGEGFDQSAWAIIIVLGAYFVWITTGSGSTILHGLGRPEYAMRRALLHLVLAVTTGIPLTLRFGYYGAVVSQGLTTAISMSYLHVAIHRVLSLRFVETLQQSVARPLLACGIPVVPVLLALSVVPSPSIWLILLLGVSYVGGYLIALFSVGGLDEYDRQLFANWLTQALRYVPVLARVRSGP